MLGKTTTRKKSYPCMTTTTTSINSMANESQLSRSEERIPLTQCKYSSEGSCPAVWGMGSLMTVLPDSPSPICSGCSTPRNSKTLCTSQVPTGFSTARKKVFLTRKTVTVCGNFIMFLVLYIWMLKMIKYACINALMDHFESCKIDFFTFSCFCLLIKF
jgi:hypothetical protein